MRPVNRGSAPVNASRTPVKRKEYQAFRRDLIDCLGEYCSYCGMELDTLLAIEHMKPKTHHPKLECYWDNLMLACTNCNSTKGADDIKLYDHFWPVRDNTFRAFRYSVGGIVQPDPSLSPTDTAMATATIELVGLDKTPTSDPKASDRRWENRREAWDMAERAKQRLARNNTLEMREQIVENAQSKGYWSIWMTVFQGDSDMLNRLIDAFPGTRSANCFDPHGIPTPRAGGKL